MNIENCYHSEIPDFVRKLCNAPSMQRLRDIGMNCGCEYTSFPIFRNIAPYSRFDHSLGAAMIVWHFTQDRTQCTAALLHDIATPAFAHVVDFLHGDHEKQESTESGTEEIIRNDPVLMEILTEEAILAEAVADYHRYPIADNPTPHLSADRLEYTCGNMVNYGFASENDVRRLYRDIAVGKNETGETELCFRNAACASEFARFALQCAKVYVCPEDRFAMQMLAELLRGAVQRNLLTEKALYTTESEVIERLCADREYSARWKNYTGLNRMLEYGEGKAGDYRVIRAKKRYIDPLIEGTGRVSAADRSFAEELEIYLAEDFSQPVAGV